MREADQQIAQLMQELLREIKGLAGGQISKSLVDLYGIKPMELEPTLLTLTGTLNVNAGNINPGTITTQAKYDHFFWGIGAFIANPNDNPANFVRREFQINIAAEKRDLFDAPVNFGALLATDGRGRTIPFLPALKKVAGNTQVVCKFSNAANDADGSGWAGAAKIAGVILYGVKLQSR